jgi:hypothetical protein
MHLLIFQIVDFLSSLIIISLVFLSDYNLMIIRI